ncbi:hypothetical protein, partial [Burkholderia gladioli]|uniref:hypothetical protein n=1 Tax=Burkholderia gladioli TaxID=28095 RepID=UPI001ABB0409
HCRTAPAARRESPATRPAWLSVCEAYVLLGTKICLEHKITDRPEIEAWLSKRIPSVRKQTLDNSEFTHLKLTFELWLTGVLSPEAQRRISDAQAAVDPKRYTIKVMLAPDIETAVKSFPELRKVVKQHFLEHPMATPIDVINPVSKRTNPQPDAAFSHLKQRGSELKLDDEDENSAWQALL